MIPATFPSVLDSSNRTKMLVYQVPSITGLTRWVDYIPVKSPASESDLTLANTYANEGFILTSKVNDITGLVPFKDYVPIYLDSTATKAWSADNDGYIPMAELAGLLLDFTTGNLDARINFSRTTNATVTNSAGLITYAPHNLLTYSEQFDNAYWLKYNASISANSTTAFNGTNTADTFALTNTVGAIYINRGTLAFTGQMSFSVRAKQGTNRYFALLVGDTALDEGYVVFDLQAGVVGQTSNGTGTTNVSGSIVADKNGFYICTMSFTRTTIGILKIELAPALTGNTLDTAGEITGNTIGNNVYIWGAQLEIGSTATTYNSTTVKNLLGYSELFDNAAWTKSNSFVQSNLITFSEAFDNAAWTKTNTTVNANSTIAPNGYQTADTLQANGLNGTHAIFQIQLASSLGKTFSFYSKAGTNNFVQLYFAGDSAPWANFDLINGAVGATGTTVIASIEPQENGWYRCVVSTTSTTATNPIINIISSSSATRAESNSLETNLHLWGAQLVQGSVAGDYRRTDAAALPVYYPNHNGVVCAEQIHASAGNGTILESYTATGGSSTFSIWIRRITGIGNVDLTMDSGATYTTQTITSSWARYSITSAPTAGAKTAGIRLVTSGDVVQVFGAMVSDSASLDPYVLNAGAAPTAAAYYGARFDYDPVTLAPKGLLIEEQRANLFLNSSLAGTNLATQSVTVTAVPHTISFYGTGTVALTGTALATVVGTGAYPTRTTLTFTPTAGIILFTVTGTVQYAQLEIGSFATSFIPTAASQVTRAADVATIQGSNFYSWYNQNEGSLVVNQIVGNASAIGNTSINIDDGVTDGNSMWFGQLVSPNTIRMQITLMNFATQAQIQKTKTLSTGLNLKTVGAYKINDFAGSFNGEDTITDTSGTTPIGARMRIGAQAVNGSQILNGTIKQISYYPQRLSNDVLKGLTA